MPSRSADDNSCSVTWLLLLLSLSLVVVLLGIACCVEFSHAIVADEVDVGATAVDAAITSSCDIFGTSGVDLPLLHNPATASLFAGPTLDPE